VEYAPEPPLVFDQVPAATKQALAELISARENRLLDRT
jgi:hypothetical protein